MDTDIWTVAHAKAKLSNRAMGEARPADHHTQWPANCHCRRSRRMAAQKPAQRLAGGLLCCLATARVITKHPAPQRSPSQHRPVSFLLDTNVVSEWTKPRPNPGVIELLAQANEDDVFLSVVTFAELRHGHRTIGRRRPSPSFGCVASK